MELLVTETLSGGSILPINGLALYDHDGARLWRHSLGNAASPLSIAVGDLAHDGVRTIVAAGGMARRTYDITGALVDSLALASSNGFEHGILLADVQGDGALEII